MTTRLTLILVAVLACAPIVFAQSGCRELLNPIGTWLAQSGEAAPAGRANGDSNADCVVLEPLLLRSFRENASGLSARALGLASGGNVACSHIADNDGL